MKSSLLGTLLLFTALSASPVQAGTGTIEVLHADLHNGKARFETFLRPDEGGRYLVSKKVDTRFQHGDRVQATKIAAKGGKGSPKWAIAPLMQRAALAPAMISGNHTIAVIMVALTDSPSPVWMNKTDIERSMFSTDPRSIASFFSAASYGQVQLTGDVYGPYTLPIAGRTSCPYASVASYARQALTAQVGAAKASTYQHFLFLLPQMACPWGGLSTVGGNPSQSWVGGSGGIGVVEHELGHAFGMWHSHALACVNVSVCAPGVSLEYGDALDTMGSGGIRHPNAVQKATVMGWLGTPGTPPILTVTANGTYALDAYETPGTGPKALRVQAPSGDWYYVEARRAILEDPTTLSGMLIHLHRGQSADRIYLLDMSPASPDWGRPALPVGGTFRDPVSGIEITAVSLTQVKIAGLGTITPPPPPPPPPGTVTLAITGHTQIGREMTFRGTLVGSTSLTAIADNIGIAPRYIFVDAVRKTWTVRVTGLFMGPHTFTVISGPVSASMAFIVPK